MFNFYFRNTIRESFIQFVKFLQHCLFIVYFSDFSKKKKNIYKRDNNSNITFELGGGNKSLFSTKNDPNEVLEIGSSDEIFSEKSGKTHHNLLSVRRVILFFNIAMIFISYQKIL